MFRVKLSYPYFQTQLTAFLIAPMIILQMHRNNLRLQSDGILQIFCPWRQSLISEFWQDLDGISKQFKKWTAFQYQRI